MLHEGDVGEIKTQKTDKKQNKRPTKAKQKTDKKQNKNR
jgi:hypothetical protein